MNISSPNFLMRNAPGDIVAFSLQAGSASAPSGIITFGQAFAPGALLANQALTATLGSSATPVQIDPKTYYADGSIKFAVLTLQHPTILPNTTLQGGLSISPSTPSVSVVDLPQLLASHNITVALQFQDGTTFNLDVGQALRNSLANGTAETWLQGAYTTQSRVSIPVSGSMRLLATVTAYADGTFCTTIGFDNDIAMGSSGGPVTFDTQVLIDGQTAMSENSVSQAQYQNWTATVYGGGGHDSGLNVQHDPVYLQSFGAIPNFNLENGVDPSVLAGFASEIASPGWGDPLASNGVTQLMPITGGRPDIGITTLANAAWLMTQDATAATFALGQASAAGAAPWNYWDPTTNTWVNSDLDPRIWTDPRGGPDTYTLGLTQQTTTTAWQLDTSHQPDLSYYAYLMTGDEKYLDELNAQASFDVTNTWPNYRGPDQIVVGFDQVRASAWNLREIDEAAWANPDGSVEANYFQRISDANWHWLVQQLPAWTTLQGQAYGQIEGYVWGTTQNRPWMQDYFASVAAEAARHGNADARTVLNWESNFLVGRFLNAANGFDPHDGVAYNLVLGTDSGTRYQTWAAIEAATIANGYSNLGGFSQSIGDYGQLALEALSDIITVTGSSDAIRAYNWLISANAPFTNSTDLSNSLGLQFDLSPSLPHGYYLAADGEILGEPIATSPSTTVLSSSPVGSTPTDPTAPVSTTLDVTPQSPTASNVPSSGSTPQITPSSTAAQTSIYRFFDTVSGAHIFTQDPDEFTSNNSTFVREGGNFGSLPDTALKTDQIAAQVYRLFDTSTGGHFYTSSQAELNGLTNASSPTYRPDLVFEPSSGFIEHTAQQTGDLAVYRFFDMTTGGHFFTSSQSEYTGLTNSAGPSYRADLHFEGVAFYAPAVNS